MADRKEQYYVRQLRAKVDSFVERKTALLETLDGMIALSYRLIVHKNKLDVNFLVTRTG